MPTIQCCNVDCALNSTEKTDPECIRRSDNLVLGMRIDRMINELEALTERIDREIAGTTNSAAKSALCETAVLLAQANGQLLNAYMKTKDR